MSRPFLGSFSIRFRVLWNLTKPRCAEMESSGVDFAQVPTVFSQTQVK